MAFTLAELENIANTTLDHHMRGQPESQTIQEKPLLSALKAKQKTFPGGKEFITGRVKNDYTTTFMGFDTDDTVTYKNPANIKQFQYSWKELHAGISFTLSELKRQGITVTNTTSGEETSTASEAEELILANILDDKYEDMDEGMARSHNDINWGDGTASAKIYPGIQHFIADDPTTGVVGAIDRATNSWWRNRAFVGANAVTTVGGVQATGPKITASASLQTLTKFLRKEVRQIWRYGGKPDLILAGSGFIEKLELEIAEKGIYTQSGFSSNKATDIAMAEISMRGVGTIKYDPTLDDLGRTNFCYFIDTRHLQLMVMQGEDMKVHNPARPPEKYVLFRGVTWTGTMICKKMNCHAVYEAA